VSVKQELNYRKLRNLSIDPDGKITFEGIDEQAARIRRLSIVGSVVEEENYDEPEVGSNE
jgi:hypothetical protein